MGKFLNPLVGDGVTYNIGSDSYPATVVERRTRTVTIQLDKTRQVGNYYADQRWVIEPNPLGEKRQFTLRRDGSWITKGRNYGYLSAGRHARLDPSF